MGVPLCHIRNVTLVYTSVMQVVKLYICALVALLAACAQNSGEDLELSGQERLREAKVDSAALKIAVTPTIDCLPIYVAQEYNMFDTIGAGVRLKCLASQMGCDTALALGYVEGAVTDLVRGQRLNHRGTPVDYIATTPAYWRLISSHDANITTLGQLDGKMVAMTRFSATDLLSDHYIDRARLSPENVYRVQVNDIALRLQMIEVNTIDAALLPEPQATAALMAGHRQLANSLESNVTLGAIAMRKDAMADAERRRQIDGFVEAYNRACDSINQNGLSAYRHVIAKYCDVAESTVDSIPQDIKFTHATPPAKAALEKVDEWLAEAEQWMDK